jgi:hypothetical protein
MLVRDRPSIMDWHSAFMSTIISQRGDYLSCPTDFLIRSHLIMVPHGTLA